MAQRSDPEPKEHYRLSCRRILGVPDDAKDEELDAMIEYAFKHRIPYPVTWLKERLQIKIP